MAGTRPPSDGFTNTRWWTRRARTTWSDLRTFQDWYLRYALQAVPGVAEVAPIGGFVRQYQVNLDPNALLAYDIPVDRVVQAVRTGNNDVGGRLVEFSGREYMVRGRGYIKKLADIENIVVGTSKSGGTPDPGQEPGHRDARARYPAGNRGP